ncbi:gamma-aminobutyric acid type B receptor subunit 2-like [Ptychodera flava]|uniref:gamma-aminobutyric acid type B receptor subunit 2-like n=1 Tax=Ptychodera flava TaxID=63121 RepID=UPI00396A5D8A
MMVVITFFLILPLLFACLPSAFHSSYASPSGDNDTFDPRLSDPANAGGTAGEDVELAIAGLMPISTPNGGWNAAGVVPAIEMAIEDVNKRQGVLDGYKLNLYLSDDQCDPGLATSLMYEHLTNKPTKLMILGSGCSIASVPVANSAHYYNLLQASFSTSGALSDKTRFPLFFQVVQSDLGLNPPYLTLLRHFGWRRVAVLYHDTLFFAKGKDHMLEILQADGVHVVLSESFNDYPVHQMESIRKNDVRIIIVMGYEDKTRKAFCEGYKQGVFGAKYVWNIVSGWYEENWYTIEDTDCSAEQMAEVVEGAISTFQMLYDVSNKTTISGTGMDEYYERYLNWPSIADYGTNEWATPAYDSVWVVALALNNSRDEIENQEIRDSNGTFIRYKRLEDFSYDDDEMLRVFENAMLNVSFRGVTGPLQFNENRERQGAVKIDQTQAGGRVTVALYLDASATLQFDPRHPFIWKGGAPPVDGLTWLIEDLRISPPLFYAACFLSCVGLVMAVFFLIINIVFRKHAYIRMSSPRLNNMIIVGIILAYLSVIMFGLETEATGELANIFCSIDAWLLITSFTLSFGAMFAKTWRVYKIFTNKIHKRQALQDTHLMGFVGILLLIDIAILSTWHAVDPWTVAARNLTTEVNGDIAVVYRVEACQCNYSYYWLGAIYAEKGLLLLFGSFLAYETRNVCVEGLNDSKQICVSVYNIVVLCVLGLTVNLSVKDNPTLTYGFTAIIIVISTSFTVCLIFVPKIKAIIADPKAEELKRKRLREGLSVHKSLDNMRKREGSELTDSGEMGAMSAQLVAMKRKLSEKDDEIKQLTEEIRKRRMEQKDSGIGLCTPEESDNGVGNGEKRKSCEMRDIAVQVADCHSDQSSTSGTPLKPDSVTTVSEGRRIFYINLNFKSDEEDGTIYV